MLRVALDLEKRGYRTYSPLADDHGPIDLIAVVNGELRSFQVKYAGQKRFGNMVRVHLAGKAGGPFDTSAVDYIAVYVEGWSTVKYIDSSEAKQSTNLTQDSKKWRTL